jgi:hypothetical protein
MASRGVELMKQIDPAKNQHDAANRADKGDLTRTEAAEQAGLSLHQQRQRPR